MNISMDQLRKWREQMMVEIEEHISTHTLKGTPLTESEKEACRYGFIRGWYECHSMLSLHGIIKRTY